MSELRITHTSTVTEDQIDHLGHMNVRYYAVNARAATMALLTEMGRAETNDVDVFDMYTRHYREQLLGTQLEVRSGVLGADTEAITIYHELANATTGELAATFVYRVRSESPIDHLDAIELPAHGAPRSIDLVATTATPTLETLHELDLAMRAPRVLDAEDTDGEPSIPLHLAPMLIWGGMPPGDMEKELVHTGPNGENVGWATMETRIEVDRLPATGTRIQSFGATTAIADKTTQMSMWAFDADTGELLVSFEVVSVLFNIDARRAMSIPDELRADHLLKFHPELGASA